MSNSDRNFHALVLGASGMSGWAFINQLLHNYPRPGIWRRITGVNRKPMNEEEKSYWPTDGRLALASGFDLHGDDEDILRQKFEKIRDMKTVTHVYYLVHDPIPDFESPEPFAVSLGALRKSLKTIESLAPNLRFIHLQYGTFIYGLCFPDQFNFSPPLTEGLPSLQKPLCDFLHYQVWTDFMKEFSKGKSWKWCETRPGEIVGFVPRANAWNGVYPVAMYLSLYAHINGQGAECPFFGSFGVWKALGTEAGGDMIAKETIHLSLLEDQFVNGQGYNVASSATPTSWEMMWPEVCAWFGLVGKPPVDNEKDTTKTPGPEEYIKLHQKEYDAMLEKHHLKGWPVISPSMDGSPNWCLTKLHFDRYLDLGKLRSTGFTEDEPLQVSWITALERMRKAKVIP
ncbi:hypothetical protein LOZ12_006212 [Ophidiomyces ophidiicola]|nr:hypothetical protein LOZ62_002613 [Ophidiomyces ophidiicola]KAI2053986.1 hypothetical protein LOZ38_001515 [Ophidiomyces ophidiicola]KAI2075040.1 hypothetical protein LOZ37_003654 [Ophidiomyces ophidiicola]KAI2076695.1 hypothetical protein LOZ39_002599 [Ophidiomyces ophidiicola]KAI2093941.1 hypothetical protein LOZ35_004062 [Ophidiomyces ophidiicola]